MKNTYTIIPVYSGDVSGVCSALYELGGLTVIHDPSGCNSTYNTHDETRWYDNDSNIFISGLCERDAIMGNDMKFLADIRIAAKDLKPEFIALASSPIPYMNGTDFKGIARKLEKDLGIPVFYVPANGMHDYTVGAGLAFEKLIDFMEDTPKIKNAVNVLGLTPFEYDFEVAVNGIKRFLSNAGFSINSSIAMGLDDKAAKSNINWKSAGAAEVNLVVSSTGLKLAQAMEKKFGIPYVLGTPVNDFSKDLTLALYDAIQNRKSQKAYDCYASQDKSKVVIIGEPVVSESIACDIRKKYKVSASCLTLVETYKDIILDNSVAIEGEEGLMEFFSTYSAEELQNTIIICDPLFKPVLPECKAIIDLSHQAFSGRCFYKNRVDFLTKDLVGKYFDKNEFLYEKDFSRIDKIKNERNISKEDFKWLLTEKDNDVINYLAKSARKVADNVYGKKVYIRGLIEFSNYCKNDCYYCGIRRSNSNVSRYRLSEEDILLCADKGYELGYRTFVLQSGEDLFFTDERICRILSKIKAKYPDCAITLSIGEKSKESYKKYFDAGADRYLLRHETADEKHYQKLHPRELSLSNRMRCLRDLKDIGYQVGCGFMVGSPYQTLDEIYEDICFIRDFKPHMVGIGPFIPHKDTPFRNFSEGTLEMTLRLLAIIRLICPKVLLPATTALGTIHPKGREYGILYGANVVMPNLSPTEVRKKYMLYDNKICTGDEAAECRHCMDNRIENIGYSVVVERGDYIG